MSTQPPHKPSERILSFDFNHLHKLLSGQTNGFDYLTPLLGKNPTIKSVTCNQKHNLIEVIYLINDQEMLQSISDFKKSIENSYDCHAKTVSP
jgi:hypothetical protein